MNMILHGIDAPNILHINTLTENLADIQEKDRVDVVMANPPFGGGERKEVQQNFPIRTGETAFLFLQHFIKMLKAGGRGGVVIKNTFLSNTDNASVSLRKQLLESCNLHTVLDLPGGTFQGAGVKTVVLFFEKGVPTRKVWFYQLDPGRNLGKTNPLNDADLAEFVKLVAVHRCSSSCFAEVFAREHGHHWTTIGVSGYGPWLISTSRSLIRCSRRGCRRHRRTHFRISRSLQTLHPSTPPALRSLRLQAIIMAARCQRTTPRPPPPSTQTPIALAVCKSRSLSRSVRTSGFPFHSLSPA